ncbi:MAG: hypothetical protein IPF96_16860 [Rhodobacter sp.]|nr:hypothetical protein [Rhodobacter sp.]
MKWIRRSSTPCRAMRGWASKRLLEQTNLSPTPGRRRIKRMETEGIVRRYTVDVDMEKPVTALRFTFLKLQSRDRTTIAKFEDKIRHMPEVTSCALVTGPA